MTRDRLRVKLYLDDKDSFSQILADKLEIDIIGKDGTGTHIMKVEIRFNYETNSMDFNIVAPETWNGHFNDYMIESMVLQKLTRKDKT